jgi:glucose/arabinose dehydrogenase
MGRSLAVARKIRRVALIAALVLVVGTVASAALGGFRQPSWTDCSTDKTSRTVPEVVEVERPAEVSAEPLAEIPMAVNMAQDPATLDWWVARQPGELVRLTPDGDQEVALELEVSHENEQGLLGVAVSPDSEHLYVDYTDPDGAINVVEYELDDGELVVDSARPLLRLEKSRATHNGGTLRVDDQGYLWIAIGDGGGAEGPQNILGRLFSGAVGPRGDEAQDTSNLWGSLLRIDPEPDGDRPYGIPRDNPFVGDDGVREEVWSYGLRNPWQFSLDRETGDLWLGDVGQVCYEEIDVARAEDGAGGGANFGWGNYEGQHRFEGGELPESVLPMLELPRTGGNCTVVGGVVYRGAAIEGLEGWYLFTDACNGQLMATREVEPGKWEVTDLGLEIGTPVAFAEDVDGEAYVVSLGGGPFKLVPEEPDDPS